jgi:hypothetical protein
MSNTELEGVTMSKAEICEGVWRDGYGRQWHVERNTGPEAAEGYVWMARSGSGRRCWAADGSFRAGLGPAWPDLVEFVRPLPQLVE